MTSHEYFKYAIKKNLLNKLDFYYATLSIPMENNDYLTIDNDVYNVFVDGDTLLITDRKTTEPLFDILSPIVLTGDDLINIDGSVETTIGRAIVNYITLVYPFKAKIPYQNKPFDAGHLESLVGSALRDDVITVKEYVTFVDCASMIGGLSKLVNVAATPKNISKPPGLEKYKKEVQAKFDKEFGEEWRKDPLKVGKYVDELRDYDKEYMKDDPSYGKSMSKKLMHNDRSKMFLSFGVEVGFDEDSEFIDGSLLDGCSKDKRELKTLFNTSRAASFNRGHETQKGGAVAKDLLRVSNGLTIKTGDCGSTLYKTIHVKSKDIAKTLNGTYMLGSTKLEPIVNGEALIGKTIKIRSPIYCREKGKVFCSTCCGKDFANKEFAGSLFLTTVSTTILTAALKSMHDATIVTVNIDIDEVL